MNFKAKFVAVAGVVLVAARLFLAPLETKLAMSRETKISAREQLTAFVGHGSLLSVLGGWRSALASVCWLRANLAWEQCDAGKTEELIELTVAADERPLYFWLNGARMIACDLPEWQLAGAPASVRRKVTEEHARRALALLETGLRWHGPDAALYVEMANLQWRRLGDIAGAARNYRLAAEQPGAPYYAARIHGELLCALGRPSEALEWLQAVLKTLPLNDPLAQREVVIARIDALQREIKGG